MPVVGVVPDPDIRRAGVLPPPFVGATRWIALFHMVIARNSPSGE
jgi:hypothetical protein